MFVDFIAHNVIYQTACYCYVLWCSKSDKIMLWGQGFRLQITTLGRTRWVSLISAWTTKLLAKGSCFQHVTNKDWSSDWADAQLLTAQVIFVTASSNRKWHSSNFHPTVCSSICQQLTLNCFSAADIAASVKPCIVNVLSTHCYLLTLT